MKCPKCESITRVYKTQNGTHYRVIRERRCASKTCGHRFQTIEFLGGIFK